MEHHQQQEDTIDDDDIVRKTDLLIQQLAAARASCGVPDSFASNTAAAGGPTNDRVGRAKAGSRAGEGGGGGGYYDTTADTAGYSVPSEVTFGGGEEASHAAASSKGGGGTLSTASTSFHVGDDEGDESTSSSEESDAASESDASEESESSGGDGSSKDNVSDKYHDAVPVAALLPEVEGPEIAEPEVLLTASKSPSSSSSSSSPPTQLKKKIMSKYGDKKKSKSRKKKKSKASKVTAEAAKSFSGSRTSTGMAYPQQQQEYGADYTPATPATSRPSSSADGSKQSIFSGNEKLAASLKEPTTQSFASPYQRTEESLSEAMRQAEIAEDAARRMREAVAVHQTMDRDGGGRGVGGGGGGGGGMQGFGPSHPQGFGTSGSASSGPRVGSSFLETGATACIKELLRCLADPLEALANDNSAPPGSSVSGLGGMEDPHPRFARASGYYEYVPVPNIRHVFSGSGATSSNEGEEREQERQNESSSERKGLLGSGTGYDPNSNW